MNRGLASLVAVACFAACLPIANITPAEKDQLAVALKTPATFEVGKDEATAAWGRAQIFAFKHSRIAVVSDFVLDAGSCPRYKAERLPLTDDRFKFTVSAESCAQRPMTPAAAEQQEADLHVFAHFVKTGELVCERDGVSVCVEPKPLDSSGFAPTVMTPGFPPAPPGYERTPGGTLMPAPPGFVRTPGGALMPATPGFPHVP